jgi:hypothetical protein
MKIESLIKRPNGTRVTLEGTKYHFVPTADDQRHLANVTIQGHIDIFLSNGAFAAADKKSQPEATKPAPEIQAAPPAAPAPEAAAPAAPAETEQNGAPTDTPVLKGSNLEPAEIEIGGLMVKTADIAQAAFEKSGLAIEDWNALTDEAITARMSEQAESMEPEAPAAAAPADQTAGAAPEAAPAATDANATAAAAKPAAKPRRNGAKAK